MESRMVKFYSSQSNKVPLHAANGHFATSHSHINYYIDLTSLKTKANEAREVAKLIEAQYRGTNKRIDTIVCMDGTETIGSFLAEELVDHKYLRTNEDDTIYVVTPEYNRNNQLMFRDNIAQCIQGKHVLLLMATTTTGVTIKRSMECISYYGGIVEGIDSLFSTIKEIGGYKVNYLFTPNDLPGYEAYEPSECPFCKRKIQIEALVNGFGYSKYMSF
ncbi:MAG: orotate phosphoribosyltransferase [Lachnospiraceae bacterium]|nr:orotate phosphoribosyltransferase [Lachnospiraceae bacterium]